MRITRLRLRNYRVFADELELEVPPGLVGVYGANGAGKSALVEAIPWALFGSSRTGNDQVRTSGVDDESVVEVELEHEGHLYSVRRTISGVNHTVRAQASADGHQVAEGVRDTNRYLRSVLGLDDTAFRASVFAEQKQLAAFASTTPARRRDLVLKLLGITPVDAARDRARREAKATHDDFARLRGLLPDLEALVTASEEARAAAATNHQAAERAGAELSDRRRALAEARRLHEELSVRAAEHESLVAEGREVRHQHDDVVARVARLEGELADLGEARARGAELAEAAKGLAACEARLRLVEEVRRVEAEAGKVMAAMARGPVPSEPDEAAAEQARSASESAQAALDTHRAVVAEVRRAHGQAAAVVGETNRLTGEADCPLCGQCLGSAFEQVQAHRLQELSEAEGRLAALTSHEAALVEAVRSMAVESKRATVEVDQARRARATWEQSQAAVQAAEQALAQARGRLDPPLQQGEEVALAAEIECRRHAAAERQRLQGRLERAPAAQAELEAQRSDVDSLAGRLDTLRQKVRSLAYSPESLATARSRLERAEQCQDEADQRARQAELAGARAEARAEESRRSLAAAQAQHVQLGELGEQARHLGRVAELLGAFRNELVGAVGPRLSRQAASLFAELTDAEYDELQVDPDTYAINICDQGVTYGLERFSGSETDLASLALRVAISEHLCFQSGGQIGLLVLDEVFGPLDADRKDRMLRALERLRGRFRQVLVVTHDDDVKDQLPAAIEVVKLPGRRATARLVERP
jgi:exonuclease SbcC